MAVSIFALPAVGAVLALAAILAVTTATTLVLHARRQEMEIMRLVGASELVIRLPLFLQGLAQGLAGAAVAVGGLYAAYRLAKETFKEAQDAQGIYISCGRWQTVSFIEALEQDLKVPVVTNTQAAIWAALSRTGVGGANPGYGQLLKTL